MDRISRLFPLTAEVNSQGHLVIGGCDSVELAAYEISEEAIAPAKKTTAPVTAVTKTGGGSSSRPFPFFGIIGLLWLMSLFRRRRAR